MQTAVPLWQRYAADNNILVLGYGDKPSGSVERLIGANILEGSSSRVIIDINGSYYRKYSGELRSRGFRILHFSPCDTDTCYYNPLKYLKGRADITEFSNNIFYNTHSIFSEKDSDPFFVEAEKIMLSCIIAYACDFGDGTFAGIGNIIYPFECFKEDVPLRFDAFEKMIAKAAKGHPDSLTAKFYEHPLISAAAPCTRRLLFESGIMRLSGLNYPGIMEIISSDDTDLDKLSDAGKTALFINFSQIVGKDGTPRQTGCKYPENKYEAGNILSRFMLSQIFRLLLTQDGPDNCSCLKVILGKLDGCRTLYVPQDAFLQPNVAVLAAFSATEPGETLLENKWDKFFQRFGNIITYGACGQGTSKLLAGTVRKEIGLSVKKSSFRQVPCGYGILIQRSTDIKAVSVEKNC